MSDIIDFEKFKESKQIDEIQFNSDFNYELDVTSKIMNKVMEDLFQYGYDISDMQLNNDLGCAYIMIFASIQRQAGFQSNWHVLMDDIIAQAIGEGE